MRKLPLLAALAVTSLAAVPALAGETMFGQSWPEVGGWGEAWGDTAQPAPAMQPAAPVSAPAAPLLAKAAALPPQPMAPAPSLLPAAEPEPAMAPPAEHATPMSPAEPLHADKGRRKGLGGDDGEPQQPVQLTADQITHDRDLGVVTAKGHVEVVQNGQTLLADAISYNLRQDVMSASGNITLMEPSGEVMFADYFELTGDFKNGVAREIKVIMADRSRMAAASATRVGGTRTDFDKAVYTPCEPCKEHPERTPLWQAKAERVTHNQAEQIVEYRDAWMEVKGVPVLYTPYISHPDPTVRRRSGFLTPTAGMNSSLGANVTTPYFWAVNENEDITFSPRWLIPDATQASTSPDNVAYAGLRRVVLAGQHRWAGRNGESDTVASLTADQHSDTLRGHVDATGKFDLTSRWRAGYEVQRQSDDTYAQVYGYRVRGNKPWLTSHPYLEGFGRQDYALVEGFSFQGITADDDNANLSPTVLPHLSYSRVGTPGDHGGTWAYNGDMLAYNRVFGTSATRLSNEVAYHQPYTTSGGQKFALTGSLRGDGYHSDSLAEVGSAFSGRVVPTASATWQYPLVAAGRTMSQVLTPMAMVAASPNTGNSSRIPNEDSIDFELDDSNVMRPNRLPGLDRIETGVRGAYGLRWDGFPYRGGALSARVAQGWRTHADSTFAQSSGMANQLSDYVGSVSFVPTGNLTLKNRVRLDQKSLAMIRNESTVSAGSPLFNASASYGYFEKSSNDSPSIFGRRHYLAYQVASNLTRNWSVSARGNNDLANGGTPLGWGAQAVYDDECFAWVGNLSHNFTYDRDYLAGYTFTINLVFKTFAQMPFTALSF